MPRKPREELEGAVHHVYARGVRKAPLFLDDSERHTYLRLLGRTTRWFQWNCLSFCLMPNHVHLIIETPRANLGRGMARLHGVYAQSFNKRHGTVGHVFQGRYGAKRLLTDAHLWTAVRYVARNPVAAGMCATPADWVWSSHTAIERGEAPSWLEHARLLELLSGAGGDPRVRYTRLVDGAT